MGHIRPLERAVRHMDEFVRNDDTRRPRGVRQRLPRHVHYKSNVGVHHHRNVSGGFSGEIIFTTTQARFQSRRRGRLGAIPGFEALAFGVGA